MFYFYSKHDNTFFFIFREKVDFSFLGPFFNPDLVVAVTTGLLNPHTHLPFDTDFKNENETYRDAANDTDNNDNYGNFNNNNNYHNCNKDNNINNIRLINVKREESEGDGEKYER